jgi:hypothetical protein
VTVVLFVNFKRTKAPCASFFFERFLFFGVVVSVIYYLVGGQIGPKNMVDDENLTAFIIRYRSFLNGFYLLGW